MDVLGGCFILWCDYKFWPAAKYFWVNGPAIFDGVLFLYFLFNLWIALNLLMLIERTADAVLTRFGW